jgi:hypothetical protein
MSTAKSYVAKSLSTHLFVLILLAVLAFACKNGDKEFIEPEVLTGKWLLENEYSLEYTDGREIVLMGLGEAFIIYSPHTNSFIGLGWLNRGTNETSVDSAKADTVDVTFLCFEICDAHQDPVSNRWKVRTKTLHRTGGENQAECNFERTECEIEFPERVRRVGWEGNGTCKVEDPKVQITLKLTKAEG